MEGRMNTKILIVILTGIALSNLWYFRCAFFIRELTSSDIILIEMGKTEGKPEKNFYCYMGVDNFCKCTPKQYKNFLKKVSASISDTSDNEILIYFIDNNSYVKNHISWLRSLPPYKLEEDFKDHLILRDQWSSDKKLEWFHWYPDALTYLNKKMSTIEAIDSAAYEKLPKENDAIER